MDLVSMVKLTEFTRDYCNPLRFRKHNGSLIDRLRNEFFLPLGPFKQYIICT